MKSTTDQHGDHERDVDERGVVLDEPCRRVGEWARLVDLLQEQAVKVWISSYHRLYGPGR